MTVKAQRLLARTVKIHRAVRFHPPAKFPAKLQIKVLSVVVGSAGTLVRPQTKLLWAAVAWWLLRNGWLRRIYGFGGMGRGMMGGMFGGQQQQQPGANLRFPS